MSDIARSWPTEPEFTGLQEGQQLYDIYNGYWTELGGSEFPHSVNIPVHGVITEEGEAIFGHHFDRMAQTEREWKVAGRLFCVAMSRLRSDVPVAEGGETVIALPRTDFNARQNEIAQEGIVRRGVAAFTDRHELDFPQNVNAAMTFPRFTRRLEDGSVELVQEHDASLALPEEKRVATSGLFVAVRRIYSPTHRQFERDVRAVEMTLALQSAITDEHEEHPPHIDYSKRDDSVNLDDDTIVERLNGQRPRTYDWGTVE